MKRVILAVGLLIAIATMLPCAAMAQATLASDKPDYHPGETVTLIGTGFQPGETVTIVLYEEPLTHEPVTWTLVADGSGNFTDSSYVVQESDGGVTFTVTATGNTSHLTAETTFTDSVATTITISGYGTVTDNQSHINCTRTSGGQAGTCSYSYSGSAGTVTLTATAAIGYAFSSWTNSGSRTCTPAGNTCSFSGSYSSYTVTLTATFVVIPPQAPTITSEASTTFVVNTAGSFTVTATGYPAPTFSETGALPSGVTWSAGVLSGTPTTAGYFPITITATNGVSPDDTQSFVLTVVQAPQLVQCSTGSSTTSIATFSCTVPSTGLPPGDTYLVVGVSLGSGTVSSVTWNGSGTGFASLGTAVTTGTGAGRRVDLWRLQNPASGTYNIVVSTTGNTTGVVAGAVLFEGVATGGPGSAFRAFTSAIFNAGTTTPSVAGIPTNPGDVVIDTVAMMNDGGPDTVGAGQIIQWSRLAATNYIAGAGSTSPTTSGTTDTMSWTLGGGSTYYCAMGAISVVPYTPIASRHRGQTIVAGLEPPSRSEVR